MKAVFSVSCQNFVIKPPIKSFGDYSTTGNTTVSGGEKDTINGAPKIAAKFFV